MISAYQPYNADANASSLHVSGERSESRPASSGTIKNLQSEGLNALVPVPRARVLLTLNQLAVMSQNGVELAEALGNVARHCPDKRLAESLDLIYQSVSSGATFSGAVAAHGRYFPSTLPPMLAAAEETGEIPETLGRVCTRMRDELEMRGTVLSALIYPIILVSASVIVLSALIIGVLPQFSKVFASMGRDVPASTQLLLDFGDICRAHWMWGLPMILATMVAMIVMRKHRLIQGPIGRVLMYGPMIRTAYRPLMTGRNFRMIASMVRGGVPLLQAVRLTRKATGDHYWKDLLTRVEDNLIDGLPASAALASVDFLPPEAPQMMATGESTGRVAEVLEDVGAFYESEAGRKIKRLVVAFEPVIILFMGVIVAGIVMSVMLPLLDVSTIRR